MNEKGTCEKHGEFILADGCPQCLGERRQAGITPEQDELEEGLNQEGFTLAGAEEPAADTAIALLPGEDLEAHGYYEEALRALEYAEKRVIATIEDVKAATDDLSLIAKVKKAMESKKREYLDPLKLQAEAIRETYSSLMDPIIKADRITREKMLAFDQEQRRIRWEQEEINRKRMEAAEAEMRLNGELSEPVGLVEVAPEPAKSVSTDMGTAGQRMIKKYRVVDFALLPDQYKIENSALLNKVVKAGIPEIPGVEIWSEPIITVNVR